MSEHVRTVTGPGVGLCSNPVQSYPFRHPGLKIPDAKAWSFGHRSVNKSSPYYRCRGKKMHGHQEGKGDGTNWEVGTDIHALLCIK